MAQLPPVDAPVTDDGFLTSVPGQEEDIVTQLINVEASQAERREELSKYLKDLRDKPNDALSFPSSFDEVVGAMGNREMLEGDDDTFWKTFLVDDIVTTVEQETDAQTKLREGMEEIRRLDMLLSEKTQEARKVSSTPVRKPAAPKAVKKERLEEVESPAPPVLPSAISLRPDEEERVSRILDGEMKEEEDETVFGEGYVPPADEAHRLDVIETRLHAMAADEVEWESKSEGVWRPESAMDIPSATTPPPTERSVISVASSYRSVRPPKPGDDYIDEMREERALKQRMQTINSDLRTLDTNRAVSQHEIKTLICMLMAKAGEGTE